LGLSSQRKTGPGWPHELAARHDLSLEIGPYADDDEAFLDGCAPKGIGHLQTNIEYRTMNSDAFVKSKKCERRT
jgi:hypothetical protein